jgi:hypothetical protein
MRSALRGLGVLALALAPVLVGCAKKLPPPGGRADQEPPLVVATRPDSGATGVARTGAREVEVSESMNERSTSSAILLAPYAAASKFEWKGKVFRYVLRDTLVEDQTYALIVGNTARDIRNYALPTPRTTHFTTGADFPPGRIAGRLDAKGHVGEGTFIWAYREDLDHAPDSTARDFDALAIAGSGGAYALPGLPVPSTWRLYAFHDVNRTMTFEPGTDLLTRLDSTVVLTPDRPVADSVVVTSLNLSAPATVRGNVVDPDSAARRALRLVVEQVEDTVATGQRWENLVVHGEFQLSLDPGSYRFWIYVDLNGNRNWDSEEPRTQYLEVEVKPAEERSGVEITAPPASDAGSSP